MKPYHLILGAALLLATPSAALAEPAPAAEKPAGTAVPEASDDVETPVAKARKAAHSRFARDAREFKPAQQREIARLYRDASRPEGRDAANTLLKKYPRSNHAGCALQYLAQFEKDPAAREALLQKAAADHADCFYADGVQVGAYARFYLVSEHLRANRHEAARTAASELVERYPDAVDHKGNLLRERRLVKRLLSSPK